MRAKVYLAVDLGAESGRAMAGVYDGDRLRLEEVHRFPNTPVTVQGSLRWDVTRLFSEIKRGLRAAVEKYGADLESVGVDTWGVDYALLDAQGHLLSDPFHYRDRRTQGMMEEAFRRMPKRDIYAHTGIQFMFINSAYQLLSEVVGGSPSLTKAERLLFMPDLFGFWLSGAQVNERTITSTSQLYDPARRTWAHEVIARLGLPHRIFGDIVQAGTVLGQLRRDIPGLSVAAPVRVVAPGCHDTASAVAAVPARTDHYAYLSSGTWSLMGIESADPIITDSSFDYGFTNEVGVFDTIRLLKNISGLWLIQESRRTWAAAGADLGYEELTHKAAEARPFTALVDPDFYEFALPGDIPSRIAAYCRRTGQLVPEDRGSMVRTTLESLALKYRFVLEQLEQLAGHRMDVLHIVGGGTRNELLTRFSANAINRPVIAGPVEATSAGNVLMQMVGTGELASLAQARELVRRSFDTITHEPAEHGSWDEAYGRFKAILQTQTQGSCAKK
jgi:rhamnulokinase